MSLNPVNSISGNGIPGQVTANYTTGSSSWNIVTQNLPGQVSTGTFPNTFNSAAIASKNYNFTWPYRGGRNYPAKGIRLPISVGIIGITSPGIVMQGPKSGITVLGTAGTTFNLNAVSSLIKGEDVYGGKPDSSGSYHYQDSKFISANAWGSITSSTWAAGFTHPDGHSKIVGWALDGYPIYGPFGYVNPTNTASGVTRLESGYSLSLRTDRPTGRTIVLNGTVVSATTFVAYSVTGVTPGMTVSGASITTGTKVMSLAGNTIRINNTVTLGSGAILSLTYPAGAFVEDFTYVLPVSTTTTLDFHNGRYGITPDFPNGTYAYFITADANNIPVYPYIIGNTYYGSTGIDSMDSTLASLATDRGALTPNFSSTITNYSINVANTVSTISFTMTKGNANSTVILGTSTLIANVPSNPVNLIVGLNTSTITVTSEFFTTSTYTITVNRVKKSINTLVSLSVAEGLLSPAFDPAITSYNLTVARNVTSLNLSFIKTDASSSVNVTGNNLVFGINQVNVVVTAEDGSVRTYSIFATRLSNITFLNSLSINSTSIPNFQPNGYYYSLAFSNTVTLITVTAVTTDNLAQLYIEDVLSTSGQPSNSISLQPGVNIITAKVISSDGSETQVYRIDTFRAYSTGTNLSSLVLSVNTTTQSIVPSFNSNIFSYVTTVSNNVTNINVRATLTDSAGRLALNGNSITNASTNTVNNLIVGQNQIVIGVTAPDLITINNYTVNVTRLPSSISSLASLAANGAILNPPFNTNVFSYIQPVSYDIDNTFITAIPTQPNASVFVNGVSVSYGQQSQSVPLSVGTNTVTVNVIAQDGLTSSTYAVQLFRVGNYDASLLDLITDQGLVTPEYSSTILDYSLEVPFDIQILEISPIFNDTNAYGYTISDSTTVIENFDLSSELVGLRGEIVNNTWNGTSTFTITTIAQDRINEIVYTLTVTRKPSSDSLLSSFITSNSLQPLFDRNTFNYFVQVPFTTEVFTYTAIPRYPLAKVFNDLKEEITSQSQIVNLHVGVNSFDTTVIAADKVSKTTYRIVIARATAGLSTIAKLSNIELSTGTFTSVFDPNTLSYIVNVDYATSSIRVKPTKQQTDASITVNNTSVISGQFSAPITVNVGTTVINILVLAEDNFTTTLYSLEIRRSGSNESRLARLSLTSGQLNLPFNRNVLNYTANVKNNIKEISLQTIPLDDQAEIYVKGFPVLSTNDWSFVESLQVGNNIFDIVVTAGDLFTRTKYTVNIIRDSAVVVYPQDLFQYGTVNQNNLQVTIIDNKLLKILTRAQRPLGYSNFNFTPPVSLQNIELLFPYRGGINDPALVKPLRSSQNIIGVSLLGVPLLGPSSGITVYGVNSSTWTLDPMYTGVLSRDSEGGFVTASGMYHFKDSSFIPTLFEQTHDDGHSNIIGFAADGYPIYGPYGYSNPLSSYSTVTTMVSKYSLRNTTSTNRPLGGSIIYTGNALGNAIELTSATFSTAKIGMTVIGEPLSTATNFIITAISTNSNYITLNSNPALGPFASPLFVEYKLGAYLEDYYFDQTKNSTLDKHNGRFCVTPDYPFGTYAYFATGNQYPYLIGDSFYSSLNSDSLTAINLPIWATPAGFISTATENQSFTRTISAIGAGVSYKLISGDLPPGLSLNTTTGVISGIPNTVWKPTENNFTVRALNSSGVVDRTFRLDVRGATPPAIITPGPNFAIGPSGEPYIVNRQFVDFQFTAISDILPDNKSLVFYIADDDGQLPPGLTLTSSGKLYGQVLDDLSLPYRASADGEYDAFNYDVVPFDYISQQEFGVRGRYVNKTYRFFLTATNGVASVKAEYIILVRDPASLLADINTYPIPPQWLGVSNLGTVLSNSYFVHTLETYDCDEGGGPITYDWITANGGITSVLPPGLTLDSTTGIISGRIAYTPVHKTTYTFDIRVIKTSLQEGSTSFRTRRFSLTVLGTTGSELVFHTDSDLGALYQGEQSELKINAYNKKEVVGITYTLQSGNLPPGLSLASDGSIQGKVNYISTQTNTTTYQFVIRATDSSQTTIQSNFKLSVFPYSGKNFVKITMKPLLSLTSRQAYDNFISNQNIFDSSVMYRPLDPAFNIRKEVEFILEHAIEEAHVDTYVGLMQNHFSRKKLQFGQIKSAFALDDTGTKVLYEVVYVELIDNLVNRETGNTITPIIQDESGTIYANSIDAMRNALEDTLITENYFTPKFMRTVQDSSGIPLGRILCMPLCYCAPGQSKGIITKISRSEFDIKQIHFDIDRLIVENTLDSNTTKYLLFPKRG